MNKEETRVVCPFCHERDFSKPELKYHLTVFGCDGLEEVEDMPSEHQDIGSLVAAGDVLFKDSLPKSNEDIATMKSYMRRKFKKVGR